MENFFSLNMTPISHHSFMRWNKNCATTKKEEKVVAMVFDPESLEEDAMERSFMVMALSA